MQSAVSPSREMDVLIDRVGAQGDGLASSGDKLLYVPLTLPAERVRIRASGDRGRLLEVLTASSDRQTPPCPHFGACGGCALQHWRSEPYTLWKVEQVRQALTREGLETEFRQPFVALPGERRRLALHARRGERRRAILGFKGRRSWEVVDLKTCWVAHPHLVQALPNLARFAAPFLEHPKSAPILHVTLTETGLAVDVTGTVAKDGGISADARVRIAELAAEIDLARATLSGETLYQARNPMVRLGPASVTLPPGGFLQAVARAEAAMAEEASSALAGLDRVVDLFCGSGAFAFRLARTASVTAFDAEAEAVRSLTGGRAGATGLKAIDAVVRDLFRRPVLASELKGFEGAVIDPPRAGALEQAHQLAQSKLAAVVSVSCNPVTFARDAKVLVAAGFRLEHVTPVDQFLWSPHMELVGVFRR